MGVAVGGNDFEDSVVDGQEGDIEGAAAQIEDQDVLLSFLLVHAVSDGGSGRLVDDPHHVETGDDSSISGGLALSIIEVLQKIILQLFCSVERL